MTLRTRLNASSKWLAGNAAGNGIESERDKISLRCAAGMLKGSGDVSVTCKAWMTGGIAHRSSSLKHCISFLSKHWLFESQPSCITMLALSPSTLAVVLPILLIAHLIYKYIQNPLRKIPAAHPLAHFTSLWIDSVRWRSIENATLKAAHAHLGPIICLGPSEISVNCVKGGIREVYAGGFEKGNGKYNWYGFFANYGGYVVSLS